MRTIQTFLTLVIVLAIASDSRMVVSLCAQDGNALKNRHAWGRFKPGAWKQVRVLTETLDEKGQVASTSTTETLTVLEEVSDTEYTLRSDTNVEVAGKRFPVQPQVEKRGYHGEIEGQKVVSRKIGDGSVTICGRAIPTEIRELVINGGDTKRVSVVHYSDKVAPFLLKRETTASDAAGKAISFQTQTDVTFVDMPQKVLAETKNSWQVQTVQKHPKGTTVTIEIHCEDVPGGVVTHKSRENDEKGQTIRRSTLELIDYGTSNSPAEQVDLMGRRRIIHRKRG